MNNPNNVPHQDSDDQFRQFERQLRDRSFGSGPRQRDQLLYQCGYAAGVASKKNELGRATGRWRAIGIAASMLACVSLFVQLRSFETDDSSHAGMERSETPSQAEAGKTKQTAVSDHWFTKLTEEHQADRHDLGTLRASGSMQSFSEVDEPQSDDTPTERAEHESTLQPRDFPRFLKGEV